MTGNTQEELRDMNKQLLIERLKDKKVIHKIQYTNPDGTVYYDIKTYIPYEAVMEEIKKL